MPKRKKSNFEKWFSFSRHKRRFGAKKISRQLNDDFSKLRNLKIEGDEIKYTHGSKDNLDEHLINLRSEFIGNSELCYMHAKIIVLIRREYQIKKNFEMFEQLWSKEKVFLLKNLNIRWLISAADTFADHSDDNALQSLSVACACLVNTIKIQESENFISNTLEHKDDSSKIEKLNQGERFPLFDGISVFKFGTDDTLRNMRWRIEKVAKYNIAGEILLEIFLRMQSHDTVYSRTKNRHTRNKTSWW